MCMRFGCNPQIIFITFFTALTLSIFGLTSTFAYRHWVYYERTSSDILAVTFINLAGVCVKD